jgi:hypothetical protein
MKLSLYYKIDSFINSRIIPTGNYRKANTLIAAFLGLFSNQTTQTTLTLKDTNGTNRSNTSSGNSFRLLASAGQTTSGIVLGTGSTPVSISDYQLETKINHGNNTGELDYSFMIFPEIYILSGSSYYTTARRTFLNNSGSLITVNELGLYCGGSSAFLYCYDRTLETFNIPDAEGKVITYKFEIEV